MCEDGYRCVWFNVLPYVNKVFFLLVNCVLITFFLIPTPPEKKTQFNGSLFMDVSNCVDFFSSHKRSVRTDVSEFISLLMRK